MPLGCVTLGPAATPSLSSTPPNAAGSCNKTCEVATQVAPFKLLAQVERIMSRCHHEVEIIRGFFFAFFFVLPDERLQFLDRAVVVPSE